MNSRLLGRAVCGLIAALLCACGSSKADKTVAEMGDDSLAASVAGVGADGKPGKSEPGDAAVTVGSAAGRGAQATGTGGVAAGLAEAGGARGGAGGSSRSADAVAAGNGDSGVAAGSGGRGLEAGSGGRRSDPGYAGSSGGRRGDPGYAGSGARRSGAGSGGRGAAGEDVDAADSGGRGAAGEDVDAAGSGGRGLEAGRGGRRGDAGEGGARQDDHAADGGGTVRYLGRVDASDPSAVRFAWQGAGVSANIRGRDIAVRLRTVDTDSVFFQAEIDGETAVRFEVPQGDDREVTVARDLSDGSHRVDIYRDTEGTFGYSVFLGFSAGSVVGPTDAPSRRIEIVGDSISAGYGDLGYELHPNGVPDPECKGNAENSSWYLSYGAIAGRALNAEVSTIARQGWGMYRSNTGDTGAVLPAVYDDTVGTYAEPHWSFDPPESVIVINLGTNDWGDGDPGPTFENSYLDFLQHVRDHDPNAWLFLTFGSMFQQSGIGQVLDRLQHVANARRMLGDNRITAFDLGSEDLGQNGEVPTGCGNHPNVADQQRMARILQQQLQDKLGW